MSFILYVVFAAAGYFVGVWALGQIIGSTVAVNAVLKEMQDCGDPALGIARIKAGKMRPAATLWSVLLVALTVVAFLINSSYAWGFVAGIAVAAFATFKNIQSYKMEFRQNIFG